MPTTLGELELEAAAKQAAGNWNTFDSFCWHRASDLDDADDWTLIYSQHRDSGLLAQSNAAAIGRGVGAVHGRRRARCRRRASHSLGCRLDRRVLPAGLPRRRDHRGVPLSRRKYESTLENIDAAAWKPKRQFDLPEGWEAQVFEWFWEHNQHAIENRDDQGGYPSETELEAAFEGLGFLRSE